MERYEVIIPEGAPDPMLPNEIGEWVKAADAQATIAALQARVNGLEKDSELLRQSRDDFRVKYESVKNDAITLQAQLTQRTAELEAANALLYKKNCALGRAETSINDLQAELERVRGERDEDNKIGLPVIVELLRQADKGQDGPLSVLKGIIAERDSLRTLIAALPKVEGEIVTRQTTEGVDVTGYTEQGDFSPHIATFKEAEHAEQFATILQHRQGMEG